MPPKTNGATNAAAASNGKRFELPAFDFNFSSLTDGTNIPPPLPSPPLEKVLTPPETPASKEGEEEEAAAGGGEGAEKKQKQKRAENKANGAPAPAPRPANGAPAPAPRPANVTTTAPGGTKRPADDNPVSPTFSTRQGSIRRLFSKNLLNSAYADGEESTEPGDIKRPDSRTSSFMDAKKAKRSSGWFSRLRHNDSSKRASVAAPDESRGPPPPMIPEFSELKTSLDIKTDGSLGGDDLFKNIK